MRITAVLIMLFLLLGCQVKQRVVNEVLDFVEIYKDNKDIPWFRFRTTNGVFLLNSTLDVTVIAPAFISGQHSPIISYVYDTQNHAVGVLISLGSQEEMYRWRNALRQGEPRVLYPLFEFKEDEVAK